MNKCPPFNGRNRKDMDLFQNITAKWTLTKMPWMRFPVILVFT